MFRALGLSVLILGSSSLPTMAAAQSWHWGAQLGGVHSWLAEDSDIWTSRDGFQVGLLARRDLTPHLALQGEVGYWRRGAEIRDTPELDGRGGGRQMKFGNLELSVLGVLQREVVPAPWSVYLAAGPILSQRIECTVRDRDLLRFVGRPDLEEMDCDSREWERAALDEVRATHLLLTGATGVAFRPHGEPSPELFLELRFTGAVTDLGVAGESGKLRSLSLSLGAVWPW